jgi:multidrug efflux pump subunit AcrA (membrane-fusion protein)
LKRAKPTNWSDRPITEVENIMHRCIIMWSLLLAGPSAGFAQTSNQVPVDSVIIRVLDQAELSARDAGMLTELKVRAGDSVEAGDIVAQLDDEEARLAVDYSKLKLAFAEQQADNELPVASTEARVREAEQLLRRTELSHSIAARQAKEDISVRLATRTRDASSADLERAQRKRAAFAGSISLAEIERLQVILDRSKLETDQALVDRAIAQLKEKMEQAATAEQQQTVERIRLEVEQARRNVTLATITRDIEQRTLELSKLALAKRQVRAPLRGVVAEVFRHAGEWVEPGTRVMRLVRLDRLRAEGFVKADLISGNLRGTPAEITVRRTGQRPMTFQGEVTFVSPEIDPVNGQVRVWAEVENPKFVLRPGMKAEMTISMDGR